MKWSDEERGLLWEAWLDSVSEDSAGRVLAIATRAVKLAAARGGTMTAEALAGIRASMTGHDHMGRAMQAKLLFEHLATLGARIAVLEADVAKARQSEDVWRKRLEAAAVALGAHGAGQVGRLDIVARVRILLDNTAQSRQREECIRRRSLEAGNLERLIAEYGIPAAMRWVVDGAEPYAAHSCDETCTHSDVDDAEMRRRDKDGWPPFPCSPTCTHDDAATPGHPERVKERSEALWRVVASDAKCHAPKHINCPCTWDPPQACHFPTPDGEPSEAAWQEAHELQQAHDRGAEAMRAACLKDVREALANVGAWDRETERIVASAIEGATP